MWCKWTSEWRRLATTIGILHTCERVCSHSAVAVRAIHAMPVEETDFEAAAASMRACSGRLPVRRRC